MPEDYEERKKLETPMAQAMPCKTCKKNKHGETRTKTTDFKSKLACILEASESTRLRVEESLPKYHEDHIARKGAIHCNIIIWYTILFLCSNHEIPAAKAAVDEEWEKLDKISAWNLTKVIIKKEVIDEARSKGIKVHFAFLMDICHLKDAELETKAPKIQRSSCTPR